MPKSSRSSIKTYPTKVYQDEKSHSTATNPEQIDRRSFLILLFQGAVLILLAIRLFFLQIIGFQKYSKLADKNRIILFFVLPPRGSIKDSNDVLLVSNRENYSLLGYKRTINKYPQTILNLFSIIQISETSQNKIKRRLLEAHANEDLILMDDLNWEQMVKIETNISMLQGLYISNSNAREYHLGMKAAHITGYIGKINKEDQNKDKKLSDFSTYWIGEQIIGKSGLESYYQNILKGVPGVRKLEINAAGYHVKELQTITSTQGEEIKININSKLQEKIYDLMDDFGSTAILLSANTGAILSAVSLPSYDPNILSQSFKNSEYFHQLASQNLRMPLFNRFTSASYAPGSIFKLVTILAALESGLKPTLKFSCSKKPFIKSGFNCWKSHGIISSMSEAIYCSCNTYIYNIAQMIGIQKILDTAIKLGFNVKSNIDLYGESKGFIPDLKWKINRFKSSWNLGDCLNSGIGQGVITASPLQLTSLAAVFANGGNIIRPYINADLKPEIKALQINPEYMDIICSGMYNVMHHPKGTGYKSYKELKPSVLIAGKSGTAQVRKQLVKNNNSNQNRLLRDHSLFVGYTTGQNGSKLDQSLAVCVIVEHGGWGGQAALPLGIKILDLASKILK